MSEFAIKNQSAHIIAYRVDLDMHSAATDTAFLPPARCAAIEVPSDSSGIIVVDVRVKTPNGGVVSVMTAPVHAETVSGVTITQAQVDAAIAWTLRVKQQARFEAAVEHALREQALQCATQAQRRERARAAANAEYAWSVNGGVYHRIGGQCHARHFDTVTWKTGKLAQAWGGVRVRCKANDCFC